MNYTEFKEKFNITADDQQDMAITSINKPTLLLAVPGSGKTITLINRVGYMIYVLGIEPSRILVLTFTRAAALDMQNRFASIFGITYASQVHFRTIGALCDYIVYDYHQERKIKKLRLLTDNTYMLRRLYPDVYHRTAAEDEIRDIKQAISRAKNNQLTSDVLKRQTVGETKLLPIYTAYQKELKRSEQMDHDDQLILVHEIFENDKEFLSKWQNLAPHVLVDEAQDVSKISYEIIRYLTEASHSIIMAGNADQSVIMAGNADQSIYGDRAAYPAGLIEFQKIYKDAQLVKLNHNYRSTSQIAQVANVINDHDNERFAMRMFSTRGRGQNIRFSMFNKREDQYPSIATKLLPQYEGETAVLFRNSDSAIPLMLELIDRDITFRCRGVNTIFFNSRVVSDIKNIMNSALHPHDKDLLWSTYDLYSGHISQAEIHESLDTPQARKYISLWHQIFYSCDLNRSKKEKVRSIITTMSFIRKGGNVREAIDRICSIGYKHAKEDQIFILKAIARDDENVKQFLSRLESMEHSIAAAISTEDAPYTLSTIHASKGYAYDNVIIMDEVNPVFPSHRGDSEEERRLFYIALTRAKNNLVLLSYTDSTQPYIDWLKDLNKKTSERSGHPAHKSSHSTASVGLAGGAVDASELETGVRVIHKKYGAGTIESIGANTIAIKFEDDGVSRKFKLSLCLGNGTLTIAS